MENKIRVGIIGTGFGAKVHAPLFQLHPAYEVVAISSVHRKNVEQIQEVSGIDNIYADWKEMLQNEELVLVTVTSSPNLHHDMSIEALKQNYHVLCEKPMALNEKQADNMIATRDKSAKLGLINFEWRYLQARQKVKEILRAGTIGEITRLNYTCSMPGYNRLTTSKQGWLGQEEKGGGMLGAIGSHMLDSLLWWTNDSVEHLFGQVITHIPEMTTNKGETEVRTADDSFQAIGQFINNGTFSIGFVFAAHHGFNWRLEVIGTRGTLLMKDDKEVYLGIGTNKMEKVFDEIDVGLLIPNELSDIAKRYYPAFYPMLNGLSESVINNKIAANLPTFEDGRKVQQINDAILTSTKTGDRIILKDYSKV